jgi:hypothetical protein
MYYLSDGRDGSDNPNPNPVSNIHHLPIFFHQYHYMYALEGRPGKVLGREELLSIHSVSKSPFAKKQAKGEHWSIAETQPQHLDDLIQAHHSSMVL